jgi:large subunit ribosomal protein L4
MRRGALRSALSERVREGNVIVVEGLSFDAPKTKDFVKTLGQLGLDGKTLIVDSLENGNLLLSARNIKRVKVVNSYALNIYDLLYHEKLVLSQAAAEELTQLLDPQAKTASADEEAETNDATESATSAEEEAA